MSSRPMIQKSRSTRGKTVGRAVIKSFIHDYLHGREENFKPLYTQRRFNAMVESIQSDHEYGVYLQYVALHNGLAEELVRSQAYAQQAQHGLLHLQAALSDVRREQAQRGLLDHMTALYGLPLDQERACALRASMSGLFVGIEQLLGDVSLQETVETYLTQLLLPALRGLMAYNTLVALLAEGLAFDELSALAAPMDDIIRDLDVYNEEGAQTALLLEAPAQRNLCLLLFPRVLPAEHAPARQEVDAAREILSAPGAPQSGTVQQMFLRLLEGAP